MSEFAKTLRRSSDELAESLLLVAPRFATVEISTLFDELYAKGIRAPNEAEVALLSEITDLEEEDVHNFCE